MALSYALITKLLRWLTRIYKLWPRVGISRSSAALIRLVVSLCKSFWSRLNPSNPTSCPTHHDHRHTNPTPPSNAYERVYLSCLPPSIRVQEPTPHPSLATDSFQDGSPLAPALGYIGPTQPVFDLSSEATYNHARCTTTMLNRHLGETVDMGADEDDPSTIALNHEPRSGGDASAREGHLGGRGTQTRRGPSERAMSPASCTSGNDTDNPRSRSRSRQRPPRELRIIPITAGEMMSYRYGRKGQADWKKSNKARIKSGCRDYTDRCPAGWVRHVQAEGAQYFYHAEKKVLTDTDIMNSERLMSSALYAAQSLHDLARQYPVDISGDTELVLERKVDKKDGKTEWMYYFVDHAAQVVFWIHTVDQKCVVGNVRGLPRNSHLKYAMEAQYWYALIDSQGEDSRFSFVNRMHREMFPLNRPISLRVLQSLKATLTHAQTEAITSDTSLTPFDADELGSLVDLVGRMEEGAMEGQSDTICAIARLIRLFADSRFVNFYGEIGARLNSDQSVYSGGNFKPSKMLPVFDILLFGSASDHLQTLSGLWVDRTVNFPRWKGFISKLLTEWNSFTIYSTVMLAVNVSLLGNPSLQDTITADPQRRAGLISIYLSLACIVGSLMISVLLVGQARGQERQSAKGAAEFMSNMTHSMLGLEALAIMQSVPYALLIWGMLCFVLALGFIIFGSQQSVIIATISPAWVIVASLCLWPVWGSRRRRESLFGGLSKGWEQTVKGLQKHLHIPTSRKTSPLPTSMPPSAEGL